jgi:CRISPR-associated protein Cas1
MIGKTLELATPGTRLSISHRQLVIDRPNLPKAAVPVEDIGVVVVDDLRATYTQSVFIDLIGAGATIIVTGRDHLPLGIMLPLEAHHVQTERHRAQVAARESAKKRIWQAIVKAKIRQQAEVLELFTGNHGGLRPMAGRVRSGDPDNLEAQAAQRYWPRLFGSDFRRDRDADGINALLNYGYAILRAAIARSVVASGLIPSLGVFHRNRGNPFCLADDLLEPYRPYVDWRVKLIAENHVDNIPDLGDRGTRAALLSLFNETILVGGKRNPLLLAIQSSAASLCRALTNGGDLSLPDGLPLDPDLLDGG